MLRSRRARQLGKGVMSITVGSGDSGAGGLLTVRSAGQSTGGRRGCEQWSGHRHDERRDHDQDCECWCEGRERRTGVQLRHDELGTSGRSRSARVRRHRQGGGISITVGSGNSSSGGLLTVASGRRARYSRAARGCEQWGVGIATTSGAITIRMRMLVRRASGVLVFSSGTTSRYQRLGSRSARVRRHRARRA